MIAYQKQLEIPFYKTIAKLQKDPFPSYTVMFISLLCGFREIVNFLYLDKSFLPERKLDNHAMSVFPLYGVLAILKNNLKHLGLLCKTYMCNLNIWYLNK